MKAPAALALLLLAAYAPAQTLEEWLKTKVQPPAKGTTEWTLVLTTGGFGRDPRLAAAARDAAVRALDYSGSRQDTVRVVAAEMAPWGTPKTVPLPDLANALPTAPAPNSRGGGDLEAILAAVAPSAKGAVLILSPGPSNLPTDGQGTLKGGDGTVEGFTGPDRQTFDLPTPDGPRPVLATLLTKEGSFTGDADRDALAGPVLNATDVPIPTETEIVREVPAGVSGWWLFPALALGGLAGYALRRQGAKVETKPVPTADRFNPTAPSPAPQPITQDPQPVEGPSPGTLSPPGGRGQGEGGDGSQEEDHAPAPQPTTYDPQPGEALTAWQVEARKQNRRLDLIAQDLAAAAETLQTTQDEEKLTLRQDLARRDAALRVWDETAMDYLDGIARAVDHPDLAPERRQTWERASAQFARLATRAGLDLIAPAPGDPVLDGQHRIDSVVPATVETPEGTVAALLAPGYRRGDGVLRPARIEMAQNQNP